MLAADEHFFVCTPPCSRDDKINSKAFELVKTPQKFFIYCQAAVNHFTGKTHLAARTPSC
jgi:hypothetical protein